MPAKVINAEDIEQINLTSLRKIVDEIPVVTERNILTIKAKLADQIPELDPKKWGDGPISTGDYRIIGTMENCAWIVVRHFENGNLFKVHNRHAIERMMNLVDWEKAKEVYDDDQRRLIWEQVRQESWEVIESMPQLFKL